MKLGEGDVQFGVNMPQILKIDGSIHDQTKKHRVKRHIKQSFIHDGSRDRVSNDRVPNDRVKAFIILKSTLHLNAILVSHVGRGLSFLTVL